MVERNCKLGAPSTATWLTESEAADYCRCSLRAFQNMGLPAQDAGGRKVFHRPSLDAAILARPWRRASLHEPRPAALPSNLVSARLRNFKPKRSR